MGSLAGASLAQLTANGDPPHAPPLRAAVAANDPERLHQHRPAEAVQAWASFRFLARQLVGRARHALARLSAEFHLEEAGLTEGHDEGFERGAGVAGKVSAPSASAAA